MEMTLNEYQQKAMTTRMPSCNNFSYMFLNLVGEVGEFASKVAKHIRKDEAHIGSTQPQRAGNSELYIDDAEGWQSMIELKKEAGDILWQLAGLCDNCGWTLEEVAQQNLEKLASRQKRGVIDGNGDNR